MSRPPNNDGGIDLNVPKSVTMPPKGALVYTYTHRYTIPVYGSTTWTRRVYFQGYYYFGNTGKPSGAPGPQLNYQYQNRVWWRQASGGHDVEVTPDHWPGDSSMRAYFWSQKSPTQMFGYLPPKQTNTAPGPVRNGTRGPTNAPSPTMNQSTTGDSAPSSTSISYRKGPGGTLYTNPPLHPQTSLNMHFDSNPGIGRLGLITVAPNIIAGLGSGNGFSKRWGFRFLYNPTTYGFNATSDPSVQAPEQVSTSFTNTVIPGTQTWNFELYLNRVPDLKSANKKQSYYGNWNIHELYQLWARGTEYDLEYLYRCVNGDPKSVKGAPHPTANIGALLYQRVTLKLGGGVYMTGIISNLSVNHVMMTANMIPTLSQVQISFTQFMQEYSK